MEEKKEVLDTTHAEIADVVDQFYNDNDEIINPDEKEDEQPEEKADDVEKEDLPSDEEVQEEKEDENDSSGEPDDAQEGEETTEESKEDSKEGEEEEIEGEGKTINLPRHMPEELKKAIGEIKDKKAQKQALKVFKTMESNHTRRSQALSEHRKFAEHVNGVFEEFGANDMSFKEKVQIIKNYANFEKLFNKDPKVAIKTLIQNANVDVSELDDEDSDYLTESQKADRQKIKALEAKISRIESNSKQTENSNIEKQIEDFKSATDAEGQLKYPYFEQLKNEMANLAKFEKDFSLEILYDKALRLNDDLFQKTHEAKIKKVLDKKDSERKKKIEKAKKIKKATVKSRPRDTVKTDYDAMLKEGAEALFNAIKK